ncbi:hypothetical protein Desca_0670 [Desulfotomaculum nigrificans CO-1-SRB]|uniref:DUF2680 domain-containing protein n=1 Tax=Desulfotomaculum nigrificans (strain DSM 14880 / VKM B-2319 / CO-1-SRB) TaxID=868595 RepID=F6B8I3_DESCC|nr:DUF2680 domain-containing protein [Desulfotomaculum nigrificans]AEF93555.1 hypothetical protein Desca_0670 [Desulfotomaculum nigrificans CO-1-SRB]
MRKRFLVIGLVVLVATAMLVPAAFAGSNVTDQAKAWFDQMFAAKEAYVDQAVKNGQLTPEQGQAWKQHFEQMKQFHAQNGYLCPGGGIGRGQGGPGWGGRGFCGGFFNAAPTQTQNTPQNTQ